MLKSNQSKTKIAVSTLAALAFVLAAGSFSGHASAATMTVPNNATLVPNLTTPNSTATPNSVGSVNTNTPISNMPDGTLIRGSGTMKVFMVQGGILFPFPSRAIFLANGQNFKNVIVVPVSTISGAQVGAIINNIPEGTLLTPTGGSTTFIIRNGQLTPITSAQMSQQGLSSNNVITLPQADFNILPGAPAVNSGSSTNANSNINNSAGNSGSGSVTPNSSSNSNVNTAPANTVPANTAPMTTAPSSNSAPASGSTGSAGSSSGGIFY